jgi:hypothetical protein
MLSARSQEGDRVLVWISGLMTTFASRFLYASCWRALPAARVAAVESGPVEERHARRAAVRVHRTASAVKREREFCSRGRLKQASPTT